MSPPVWTTGMADKREILIRHFAALADELTGSYGPLGFGFSVCDFFASTSYCERQAGHSRTDRVPSTDTTFFRPGD